VRFRVLEHDPSPTMRPARAQSNVGRKYVGPQNGYLIEQVTKLIGGAHPPSGSSRVGPS